MNIEQLTIAEARQIAALFSASTPNLSACSGHPWQVGKNYLIRTVTMIDIGKLVAVTEHELVLENAAWVADTGRFADALKSGEYSEVEPFPDGTVIIGRGSVVDAVAAHPAAARDRARPDRQRPRSAGGGNQLFGGVFGCWTRGARAILTNRP